MTLPKQADLARQVEYYFTKRNLSTDTYLERLRQLNDGCVPVSILANFGRVRAMAVSSSSNREKAIVEAIMRHSTSLAVYAINTTTGKRVPKSEDDEDSCENRFANGTILTILAVGLSVCDEHPPDSVGLAKGGVDTTDTIILRDVHPIVNESEIRALFEAIEQCPPVEKICADVGQCWFVTFDKSNRTDLMKVMLAVRSMQYPSTGEYVLARLKASVSVSSVEPMRKPRRKRRGKKTKKSASSSPPVSPKVGNIKSIVSLPCLTSDQFPALHYNTFEWDTASSTGRFNDDDDATKEDQKYFDAASTTTTTSSTASPSSAGEKQGYVSGEKQGYAAALMNPPGALATAASRGLTASSVEWSTLSTE